MRLYRKIYTITLILAVLLLCSCKKTTEPDPEISIGDVSQERTTTESTMIFTLNINIPSKNEISVDYTLNDGTAVSPTDFEAASGTVSIPAGQTQTTIEVLLKGDPLNVRQKNLEFTLQLSNPKNCTIANETARGIIITEDGTYLTTDNTGYTTPSTYPGYSLIWSDEFSGNTLDLTAWNQEIGNGNGGWGNNELEYYTKNLKNTFVSNGNLIIEARKETFSSFSYTSGRMTTQNKKFFKFGRIDIRAKIPVGKGIWPALWMLGTNISSAGWPACGEIDIMELIGTDPNITYGTLHWANAGGSHVPKGSNYTLSNGDFSQEFHVFSILWEEDQIKWYVDDQLFLSVSVSDVGVNEYPFNADQFFIFNVAVGGNWPGSPDYTTEFPQRMFVDYVRVFQ